MTLRRLSKVLPQGWVETVRLAGFLLGLGVLLWVNYELNANQTLENCREIEGLKREIRKDSELNLETLRVPKAAERLGLPQRLIDEAIRSNTQRIVRFQEDPCPRP
jgi:hypothetical protein